MNKERRSKLSCEKIIRERTGRPSPRKGMFSESLYVSMRDSNRSRSMSEYNINIHSSIMEKLFIRSIKEELNEEEY